MENLPQREQKHPDEYQRDLNPDHLEGQNIGPRSAEAEQSGRTAYNVREVHRRLSEFSDDDLKQIPVLEAGTRLQQGATYLKLDEQERREFTATGEMQAGESEVVIPKSATPFPIWNRLRDIDDPERL